MHIKVTCAVLAGISLSCFGQNIPGADWTPTEKQFVEQLRAVYRNHGATYADDQATLAVKQLRDQKRVSPQGIPSSEWTAEERALMLQMKEMYAMQGRPFSDSDAQASVQKMREVVATITGQAGNAPGRGIAGVAVPAMQPAFSSAASIAAAASQNPEERVGALISRFPGGQERVVLSGRRDGFDINGVPYLDAEGRIVSYSYAANTGFITYMAQTDGGYVIKTMRANSGMEPVAIATANKSLNGWDVQTASGKRLTGWAVSMVPIGLMVARDTSAFRYEPGKGVSNIVVPNGYVVAPMQRGDVGGTDFILLERENSEGGNNPLSQLVNSTRELGAILGMGKKEDYALMNIRTGKLYPLNIGAGGKNVHTYSNCVRKNRAVNACANMNLVESLYDSGGGRNTRHYYWRVQWMVTPAGPAAVTHENGSADVYVLDLNSGKKVSAFSRALGIVGFDTVEAVDGTIKLTADWAFQTHEIPDIVAHLQSSPGIEEPQKTSMRE